MDFGLKKYIKNKDLRTFFIKTVIFFVILFSTSFFISFYFRHTSFFLKYLSLPSKFYLPFLTGLKKYRIMNSAIFVIVISLIFIRKKLAKLKVDKLKRKNILIFGSLSLFFLIMQYLFKYLTKINLDFALQHTFSFTIVKLLINILFIISLALAIYGYTFIKRFIKTFWKEIIIFSIIFVFYYFIIDVFGLIWFPLSVFITRTLYFLFSLSFSNVVMQFPTIPGEGPRLGLNDFIVGISKDCSGIDSLLFFISLFAFLFVLNWKFLDKKRMAILFIPGLLGAVAYNILRIYLLMLVGVFISPEFAIDMFHSNIGWMLFLIYFFVFWHFGSKYVYKKSKS